MTAQHDSDGATGVLDRPGVDIAGLIGGMPVTECEYREFENSPCCGAQARWAARVHIADHGAGTCEVIVEALCDLHKTELTEWLTHDADTPCAGCGVATASVFRLVPL
ncbi:hypothetical protein [Mycobacteroides chelonae]|uniref:hypothetical protein n=1 Tax=Mycobacteroides chelonae TaxID=1774 RepID=UPI0018B0D888|nr:hypothetical protein [Mycobacteroides chelonae]MBF9328507.1 hypothetical protein [Mycobacteroides chelonae]MBF9422685.1 hypothetical protein [Mycobacteroides chelonae]